MRPGTRCARQVDRGELPHLPASFRTALHPLGIPQDRTSNARIVKKGKLKVSEVKGLVTFDQWRTILKDDEGDFYSKIYFPVVIVGGNEEVNEMWSFRKLMNFMQLEFGASSPPPHSRSYCRR